MKRTHSSLDDAPVPRPAPIPALPSDETPVVTHTYPRRHPRGSTCILNGRFYENGGNTISEMDMNTGEITREFPIVSAVDCTSPIHAVGRSCHIIFRAGPFETYGYQIITGLGTGGDLFETITERRITIDGGAVSCFRILDTSTGKIIQLAGNDTVCSPKGTGCASKVGEHMLQMMVRRERSEESHCMPIVTWDLRTGECVSRTCYSSDVMSFLRESVFFSPSGKYGVVKFQDSNLHVWGEYEGELVLSSCNGLIRSHSTLVSDVAWLGSDMFACIAVDRWGNYAAWVDDPDDQTVMLTNELVPRRDGAYLQIYDARLRSEVRSIFIEDADPQRTYIHTTPCGGFIMVQISTPDDDARRFRVYETKTLECVFTGISPLWIMSMTRNALGLVGKTSDDIEIGTLRLSPALIDCPDFRLHADGTLVNHVQGAALPNPPCDPVLWREVTDIVALNLARPIGERFCLGDNPLVETRFDLLQTILFHSRGVTQKSGTWIPREILKIIAGYAFAD